MDLVSLLRHTNTHKEKPLRSKKQQNNFLGPHHVARIVSVRMRHQCSDRRSSRKRKEADKQQDVNYAAAVKSTLHVGLKLSTVNREECQTATLESAS